MLLKEPDISGPLVFAPTSPALPSKPLARDFSMNRQSSKAAICLGTLPRWMEKRSPGRRCRLIQSLFGADDEQGIQEFRPEGRRLPKVKNPEPLAGLDLAGVPPGAGEKRQTAGFYPSAEGLSRRGLPEKVWEIYRGNMVSWLYSRELMGLAWPSAPVPPPSY
jgi:hypothetical protein